jgi:carboxypeptidase Taq
MTAYQQLEARFRQLGAVEEAISVLNWDSATMMPSGGAATRAEQLATLGNWFSPFSQRQVLAVA